MIANRYTKLIDSSTSKALSSTFVLLSKKVKKDNIYYETLKLPEQHIYCENHSREQDDVTNNWYSSLVAMPICYDSTHLGLYMTDKADWTK
jgi:hypothetical protein